jgi:hypothetical protein
MHIYDDYADKMTAKHTRVSQKFESSVQSSINPQKGNNCQRTDRSTSQKFNPSWGRRRSVEERKHHPVCGEF